MVDQLFCKKLPITLKFQDKEERKASIQVTVELHSVVTPIHRKELVVRLTDETDLFFLYTLKLTEEDFQSLKVQQGLLVDFLAFPQKFIDLLTLVIQEQHKDVPKFILDFVSCGSSGMGAASLNVIETNPFKHLTHLALKFLPGCDTNIKSYLADCLKTLKEQNATLLAKLEHTETDLTQQLRQTREALSARTIELDSLRSEWLSKTNDMSTQHAQLLTQEKEKALHSTSSSHHKYEREKKELEQAHLKIVKQLQSRNYEIEQANKDLTDKKYKSESTIRELRSKLNGIEEDHQRCKSELQTLRKDNAGLDADVHEQEKHSNQIKTRLAVLEQEVKDKEEVLKRSSDLLTKEQEQKKQCQHDFERKQRHVGKLETSIKTMSEELIKGNEIIKKLQSEVKSYHAKLKLRTQVTTEQEKLLGEKNREMEEMRRDLETTKTALRNKEEENMKLNESVETTMKKLEESRQLLKSNEDVISWLNRQLTETQITQQRHGPFEMSSATSSAAFRPNVAMHNYSGQSYGASSRLSTTASSQSTIPSSATMQHYHRPPQVQYQGGSAGAAIKSGMPLPLAKSSPINTIPEDGPVSSTMGASPAHLAHPKPPAGNGMLESKYLQRGGDIPLRSNKHIAGSASPLHFNHKDAVPTSQTTAPVGHSGITSTQRAGIDNAHAILGSSSNTVRLAKDIVQPNIRGPSRPQSRPPLASAYFPGQANVT